MMQNAVNESFWDAHGVEIGPCADFPQKAGIRENLPGPEKKTRAEKIFSDSMLWGPFELARNGYVDFFARSSSFGYGVKRRKKRPCDQPCLSEIPPHCSRSHWSRFGHKKCRKLSMPQSRRHERPRSSRLQHSASFRATKPNKASMTSIADLPRSLFLAPAV